MEKWGVEMTQHLFLSWLPPAPSEEGGGSASLVALGLLRGREGDEVAGKGPGIDCRWGVRWVGIAIEEIRLCYQSQPQGLQATATN